MNSKFGLLGSGAPATKKFRVPRNRKDLKVPRNSFEKLINEQAHGRCSGDQSPRLPNSNVRRCLRCLSVACGHLPSFRGSAPVANGVRRSPEAQPGRWLRPLMSYR